MVSWYLNLDLGEPSSQLNTVPRVHASKPINTRDKETLSDMLPTGGKYTGRDGRNIAAGMGVSAITRDHGSTSTAPPAGLNHLANKSAAKTRRDEESHNSSDEDRDNLQVTALDDEMNRYQPRGQPNVPAKGRTIHPPQQQTPQSIPGGHVQGNSNFIPQLPQQQPPPATPGVPVQGKKGNRTPATTAYQQTTAGKGKKRPNGA